MVNHHGGLAECLGKLADIFEGDADPKQVAEQLRTCAKLHHAMAVHHKQAATEIGKAAGLADSDAIAPMPGISVIAEPPQGLRLIRRAGGPDVPVAPSGDDFLDKILSVES